MLEHLSIERNWTQDPPPSENRLAELLAIQTDLLLGQGLLYAWKNKEDQVWGALQIQTNEGLIFIDPYGEIKLKREIEQQVQRLLGQAVDFQTWKAPSLLKLESWGLNGSRLERAFEACAGLVQKQGLGMQFIIKDDFRKNLNVERFGLLLVPFNCHPKVGEGIARSLIQHGERTTTTRYHLLREWDGIKEAVRPEGVEIVRTWPFTKPITVTHPSPLSEEQLENAVSALAGQYSRKGMKV